MSAFVNKIVLKTPAAVGSMGQFSALELCRSYAATATGASNTAVAAQTSAQGSANVAASARDVALASVGAVKVTVSDAVASVLNTALTVSAPLNSVVVSPGGNESLNLTVSGMSGATAAQPGSAGVAPAPQAGDQLKFLRGDATWQTLDRTAVGMANVQDTWTDTGGAVTYLSGSQAAIAGNCLALVLPNGLPGRAIMPDQPAGTYGSVTTASYDSVNARTLVTIDGFTLTAQCARLWIGQDPNNAPSSSSTGSDLYLAATYNCILY